MVCCKSEEYEWCKDETAGYVDVRGDYYCIFHAPLDVKSKTHFNKDQLFDFNNRIFERIKEHETCDLSGTIFPGDIHFPKTLPSLTLRNATFNGTADFGTATFNGSADFGTAKFNGSADFTSATFNGMVFFHSAFSGMASFNQATFSNAAIFTGSEFKEADFYDVTFGSMANFTDVIFSNEANFIRATFSSIAYFIDTTFIGTAYFVKTIFYKQAYFLNKTFYDNVAYFSELILQEGKVRFEKVNLKQATFIDTNLAQVDFINCDWTKSTSKFDKLLCLSERGRDILFDEDSVLSSKKDKSTEQWKEDVRKVEILYRMLKKKCKDEHDETQASNWHYGEKEMKRIAAKKPFGFIPCNLLALYRLSSGYGESYCWSCFILLLLYVLATILIAFFGIVPVEATPTSIPFFSLYTRFAPDKFWKTVISTLSYFTFQRDYPLKPASDCGALVKIFFQILIPVQATFFVLALRNKFRR